MPLDNKNELFYLVDENDNELGSITRFEAHSGSMKIHRSVGIFIENDKGEILLQQRSKQKDIDPELWGYSVSGHVTYKDSYPDTAIKEIREEIGVSIDHLADLGKFLIITKEEKEMASFYKAKVKNIKLKLDPTEVQQIKWVALSKLTDFVKTNNFTDWSLQAFKLTGYINE